VASSFVIYVDESGDDGFRFKPKAMGSSQWFALTAVITRKNCEPVLLESMRRVKAILERNQKDPMHFRELKHNARLGCPQFWFTSLPSWMDQALAKLHASSTDTRADC